MTLFTGEFVAQFKYTLLLMPNGPMKITGLPLESDVYQSEYNIEDKELKVQKFENIDCSGLLFNKLLCI